MALSKKQLIHFIQQAFIISLLFIPLPFTPLTAAAESEIQQDQAPQKFIGSTLISDNWRLFLTQEMYMRNHDNSIVLWNNDLTVWITQFNIKQSKVSLLADIRKRIPEGSKITIDENNEFYHLLAFEQLEPKDTGEKNKPLLINGHAVADTSFVLLGITCKSANSAPAAYELLRSLEHKIN